MKKIIFLLVFHLTTLVTFANDTTLTNQRIQRIKQLAEALSEKSEDDWGIERSDSVKRNALYRSVIDTFFRARILDMKFYMRSPFFSLDQLIAMLGKDSLMLKAPNPTADTLIVASNYPDYFANTIILYLPIADKHYEGFYFAFKENSSELIYLIQAGGYPDVYRQKKKFLHDLHDPKLKVKDVGFDDQRPPRF